MDLTSSLIPNYRYFLPLIASLCFSGQAIADSLSLQQGIEEFRNGRYKNAEIKLNEAVMLEPQSSKAFFYLGLASSKQGNYEQAVGAIKRAMSLNPNLADAHLVLGISYYRLGLDNLAISSLKEASIRSDTSSTALFFLGLTYRKQGQHEKAINAFEQAMKMDSDYSQVGWYNIGLSQQAIGNANLAEQAFENAVRINSDPEITSQASEILGGKKPQEIVKKPWAVSAHAGFEYDDNVTISQIDTTTNLDDYASVFDFSGYYNLVETEDNELQVGYDFYQSVYAELSDFDLQSHNFSLSGSHDLEDNTLGMNYVYTFTTLGGDRFFETHSVMPTFGFSPLSAWYVNLFYNYLDKNFFNNDARDAGQHAVGIDNYLFSSDQQAYVYLGYRAENENTTGPQFSYLGHYVTTKINSKFSQYLFKPEISLGYKYFIKDYDNLTPSIGAIRQDRRHAVNMGIDLHLNQFIDAKLEYQYLDSISNLPTSNFQENIVTFSLGASY